MERREYTTSKDMATDTRSPRKDAQIIKFPSREEDHAERLSHRPPFHDDENVLVIDAKGNQNSPEGMTDGMELLDLEAYVTHDGYGPEAYEAWLKYTDDVLRKMKLGKSALDKEIA